MTRKTISVKMLHHRYCKILILLITVSISAFAGIELKVVRTSSSQLEIQLINSEGVSGVQFCIRTSYGIVLESVKPGDLTVKPSWIFDSYKVNDSTVNVLVLNANRKIIPIGSGILASVVFTMVSPNEMNSVELANVMVIDAKGDSLGVRMTNLAWNSKIFPPTNADESNSFVLGQNYPNPFNPSTILSYRMNTAGFVRLSVYDMSGREVSRLVDQYQYAGTYNVTWDSNSNGGLRLASGMYVARLNVNNNSVSRKMLLTK